MKKIKVTLDGKNVEAVLTELGTKLHRVILDHLQQFQYSSIGMVKFFIHKLTDFVFIEYL